MWQAGYTKLEALQILPHIGPESGWNPSAKNPQPCGTGHAIGILQICSIHVADASTLLDPVTNIAVGLQVLRSQGEGAWDTRRDGGNYTGIVDSVWSGAGKCSAGSPSSATSPSGQQPNSGPNSTYTDCFGQQSFNSLNPFDQFAKAIRTVVCNMQAQLAKLFLVFLGVVIILVGIIMLTWNELKPVAKLAVKATPVGKAASVAKAV